MVCGKLYAVRNNTHTFCCTQMSIRAFIHAIKTKLTNAVVIVVGNGVAVVNATRLAVT